jgi:hypothetical protein
MVFVFASFQFISFHFSPVGFRVIPLVASLEISSKKRSLGDPNLEADARDVAVESLALLARDLELERRRLAGAITTSEGSGLHQRKADRVSEGPFYM